MDDLISRQAAIDYLVNNMTWYDEEGYESDEDEKRYSIEGLINGVPSAQQEIIRCRDCKHRYVDGENVRFNVCELNHNKVQSDDWFCADAERKEGEADD